MTALASRINAETRFLTTEQAAEVASVPASTVRRWVSEGRLEAVRFEGRLWLLEDEVLDVEAAIRTAWPARRRVPA